MSWNTTHPTLLERVRDTADHAAWREFDDCYGDLIVRYCRSRGFQQSDAEDVRQIVLINLSSAMPRFRYSPERGRFRGYLATVVRNAMTRVAARRDRHMPSSAVPVSWIEPAADEDQHWEREWTHHHLRRAMRSIRQVFDPRSVEAFDRLLDGMTVANIATEMNMTVDGVHKIKQRIRNRLRELVAEQIREEDAALA